MMFHPSKPPVTVESEEEERALGAEWSRKVFTAALEPERKPAPRPQPEPEPEEPEPEEQPPERKKTPMAHAPPVRKPAKPATSHTVKKHR